MNGYIKTIGLTALAAGLAGGCATNDVARVGEEPRQQISYAATARYPGNAEKSDRVQLTAVNDVRNKELTLYNTANQTVPQSSVWVNGGFVTRIAEIPPLGYSTIKYTDLLEAGPGTNDLRSVSQPITKIEVQTPEGLYTVSGPAQR